LLDITGRAEDYRSMCRKLVAALLIIGWISLSGFDVVEDLDEVPGKSAVSGGPKADRSTSKRGRWGLANNIIESANRTPATHIALASLFSTIAVFDLISDFHRHFPLHKLYRVFLI
jgi:hypothetical protein